MAGEITRRAALGTLGAGVVLATTGCIGASGPSKFQKQLETVREATKEFSSPKTALEAGFKPMGPSVPGMGWHFNHPGRSKEVATNGFSLDKPNLITFVRTDDGLTLAAAEWGAPASKTPENPDLFADENANATEKWHTHKSATHVFALADDKQTKPSAVPPKEWVTNDNWAEFRPPNPDLKPGDTVSLHWGSLEAKEGETTERVVDLAITHPDLRTLHAWVHVENPEGVFKPVNPEFSSGGHDH